MPRFLPPPAAGAFCSLCATLCCATLQSCGLETVVTVNAPTVTYSSPLYSSDDYLTWYASFLSAEDNGGSFMGTEVYYKIYNSSSTLVSERSAILSVNSASNNTAAATRMIETYSYQPLGTSPSNGKPLFVDSAGAKVTLRLKSYKGHENHVGSDWHQFRAGIDGAGYEYDKFRPFRNGNTRSFDFFDDDEDNKGGTRDIRPAEGDADYKHSASGGSDEYFVQLFAVGVAYDQTTLSNTYSLVLDLGSVPIRRGR